MNLVVAVSIALAWASGETPPSATEPPKYKVEDCVRVALERNAKLEEAEAKVLEIRTQLAEIESVFYPKLTGIFYISPMFTVRGSALQEQVEVQYTGLSDWGPYTHLQAVLAQPITTFGRFAANERALKARIAIEEARVREAEQMVALEVRKLYFGHLFAKSLLKPLERVLKTIKEATKQANEKYESGDGSITQIDLNKLQYAEHEAMRFLLQAEYGRDVSLAALKHTMGLPQSAPMMAADKRLPRLPKQADLALGDLMLEASQNRPEWAQLDQGEKATLALQDAETLANMPALFLAGLFEHNWTPMRDDATNPYHNDPYNGITGGIALGVQFNFDPWRFAARSDKAAAQHDQVIALKRFAQTGIPLQVRQAFDNVGVQRETAKLASKSVKATRKWMTFAASAFATGTGEPRDLLEGVGAYTKAKHAHYQSLYQYFVAEAALHHALGRDQ
ncbi:MAG: TolC family protein [Myxococcota bacterium]|nr:TolC family protein [Myxococcota bacterium]